MKVGFTATRGNITPAQRQSLRLCLSSMNLSDKDEFHHGDCVGGDNAGHLLVLSTFKGCNIHIHPPANPKLRAFCSPVGTGRIWAPEPYMDRNHVIVNETDCLFACPGDEEFAQPRSGTWATVRYAKKQNAVRRRFDHLPPKPIVIIYPDGHRKDVTADED